jgi:hypothetical protein
MPISIRPRVAAVLPLFLVPFMALAQGDSAALQKRLNTEFSLTKVTADRSDIVTAGSVLVLHKDGLLMYSTPTQTPPLNTYKDGRIQQNSAGNYFRGLGGVLKHGGDSSQLVNTPQRKFVSGEKFWVTAISIDQDGLVFNVYSDPFNDVRYYGQLKFPFPKNSVPPTDDMVRTVEEVVTVAPADDANNQGSNGSAAPQNGPASPQNGPAPASSGPAQGPAAPAAAMAPIAPPPPPSDQAAAPPKTIAVGQTKDAVISTWGQPTKDIKLANKEILVYPDMKVTFVAGKVSDVE